VRGVRIPVEQVGAQRVERGPRVAQVRACQQGVLVVRAIARQRRVDLMIHRRRHELPGVQHSLVGDFRAQLAGNDDLRCLRIHGPAAVVGHGLGGPGHVAAVRLVPGNP